MASDEVLRRIEKAANSNSKLLNLFAHNLTKIPKEVFQLKNLEWLFLSHNKILEIPNEISQLQNLTELYM